MSRRLRAKRHVWGTWSRLSVLSVAAVFALAGAVLAAAPATAAATPSLLPNGFTAKVIAYSGEHISGTVNATGFDLGIYVGPGVTNVTIEGATVYGANDEGILVQDTANVVIKDNIVKGNAVSPAKGLSELKAIILGGTRNVVLTGNVVEDNAHGGIGIYDDGPDIVYAPVAVATRAVPSIDNMISHNLVKDNLNDCSIVLSAKNPGGGVYNDVISGNTVQGFDPMGGDYTPGVGGIIVAGGAFGAVTVQGSVVLDNTVIGGFLPGISIHATAGPGSIVDTNIVGNTLEDNNAGSPASAGVQIVAVPAAGGSITGTLVVDNHVIGDTYGVFHIGDTGTRIVRLTTVNVQYPIGPPSP